MKHTAKILNTLFSKKYSILLVTLLSGVLYLLFAYTLQRTEFSTFLLLWTFLFGTYTFLYKNIHLMPIRYFIAIGVLFRLLFLVGIPNLSQDFYRFIWDGRMILEGFNPYLSLPQAYIENGNFPINQAEELYAGMGSMNGSHYTNYPPINQLCFLIAAILSKNSILGSVVVMRSLIILADIGIFYFGYKLLKNINSNPNYIFLYFLNPFIIIELTGNLHFESVMLFFFVWSIYLLQKRKWILAGFVFSLSITVKLIPLIFIPLFFKWFTFDQKQQFNFENIKKLLLFYAIIIISCITLFLPFYSPSLIANYSNSVGLWFRNFEFNASFYYIFREIGYLFRGYNEIAIIGKISPVLTIIFLLIVTFFRKNYHIKTLISSMLLALSFYYFTTTTMHPWYLSTLIILCVFTRFRYPIIWSFVMVLSYQAYANTVWKENLWFVALEYLVVYCFLFYELKNPLKKD